MFSASSKGRSGRPRRNSFDTTNSLDEPSSTNTMTQSTTITTKVESSFHKLKKSASMTPLRKAFTPKLEAQEIIPSVSPIPAKYAMDDIASVERFPSFGQDVAVSPQSGSTTTIKGPMQWELPVRKKPSFMARANKSIRSLTFSSKPTTPTRNRIASPPQTAPLQQGIYTTRPGGRFNSTNSYGSVIHREQIPRIVVSIGSATTARSNQSISPPPRQFGPSKVARREEFIGIGQEPPLDIHPNTHAAIIRDGPGGSKIARSGAPSLPLPIVADIDPELWDESVHWMRQRVEEEDSREAYEAEQAKRQSSTPEKLKKIEHENLKKRIIIGTNYVKRTSRLTYKMDWKHWSNTMSAEDAQSAYDALSYWTKYGMKRGGSDAGVKGQIAGILERVKERIVPSSPYVDVPKPREDGKPMPKASIPPMWKEWDEKYKKREQEVEELSKHQQRSAALTALEGSPPTGLGIMGAGGEQEKVVIDPSAVINITPRQRHVEQSYDDGSDGSVVRGSAEDDEEMDATPSEPGRAVHPAFR